MPPGALRPRVSRSTAFLLVAFAFLVTMLGTTLPTPLYPLYADRFGFDRLMVTVIYALYAVGVGTALLLFGSLSDQIGRRRMLLAGLLLSALSAVVFLIAGAAGRGAGGGVTMLLVGRALSGLSAGIFTGTATAALVDLATRRRPGRASLVAAAVNMGGLGLGPLLAGLLAQYAPAPLRLCFLVDLGLLAAATAGIWLIAEPAAVTSPARLRVQRLRVPAGMRGTFVRAVIGGFTGFAVLGMYAALAPAFLGQVLHHTNRALTGLVVCAGFASSILGQLASAVLAHRRALLAGCAGLVLAGALVAASLAGRSLALLVAGAMVAGLAQGLVLRAGLAMVTGASPVERRGEVASSFFIVLYVALSIPVVGVGAASQRFGLVATGEVFAALVALLALAGFASLLRMDT